MTGTPGTPHPGPGDGPTAALLRGSAHLTEPPPQAPRLSDLAELAADGQRRARELLAGRKLPTDPVLDLLRLLHHSPPLARRDLAEAAGNAGLTTAELSRLRAVYRHGGPAGAHAAMLLPVDVTDDHMLAAAEKIRQNAAGTQPELKIHQNRISDPAAGVEIRFAPDHRWHPFTAAPGGWAPAPGHNPDPLAAYHAALNAARARRHPHR